jgi:DNA-binding IclR family transcriptional regulator
MDADMCLPVEEHQTMVLAMKQSVTARRRRPKARMPGDDAPASATYAEQYSSKALTRALDVLASFTNPTLSMSMKEISQRAEIPESTLFRVLLTLQAKGYLSQNADGSYVLAPRVVHGKLYERAEWLREVSHPKLQTLARQFDETTSMAFLFEDHIRVIDSIESFHDIRAINKVGRILPPYASSMGKSITAFQERSTIDRIIEVYGLFRRTEHTNTDRRAIYEEFESIRKSGFAFDQGEAMEGGLCIGAPIYTDTGSVEASLSISVPLNRMKNEREKEILSGLLRVAGDLSETLSRVGKAER